MSGQSQRSESSASVPQQAPSETAATDFGSNAENAASVSSTGTAAADPVRMGGYEVRPDGDDTLRSISAEAYGTEFYWNFIWLRNLFSIFDNGRVFMQRSPLTLPEIDVPDPAPDGTTAAAGGDQTPFLPRHEVGNHGHHVIYPDAFTPFMLPAADGEHAVHETEYATLVARWAAEDVVGAVNAGREADSELGWFWDTPEEAEAALDRLSGAGFTTIPIAVAAMGTDDFDRMKGLLPGAAKDSWRWGKVVASMGRGTDTRSSNEATLRTWFMAMPDDEVLAMQVLMGWRFNVTVEGREGGAWNGPGLRRAWEILEMLPPAHVQNNPDLLLLVRDNAAGGSGYYASDDDSAVMGYGSDLEERGSYGAVDVDTTYTVQEGDTLASIATVYGLTEDELKTMNNLRSSRVRAGQILVVGQRDVGLHSDTNLFNTVLRHEIGHAVDANIGASTGYATTAANAGQWATYADGNAFVDAIIGAAGGLGSYPSSRRTPYRDAMYRAVADHVDFNTALATLKTEGTVRNSVPAAEAGVGGPVKLLFETGLWAADDSPWYSQPDRAGAGGRTFVESYGGDFASYLTAARRTYGVSSYQFRAPGEWFAEAYAAYYSDHPDVTGRATGTALRSRDPASAAWFDANVDAGYSLSSRAPGASGSAGAGGGTP